MLYICATPIGNLKDISLRALEVLSQADIILCEDTRVSIKLLNYHGINNKRLVALHEHNENEISIKVLNWVKDGLTIVQISDAGTPGISDPGARLCLNLMQHGVVAHPIPGACAAISLLSVSGLVNTPCLFFGFLESKSGARIKQLKCWEKVSYAVCIYESPHRIEACLQDMHQVLGAQRQIIIGRELTKQFETILYGSLEELSAKVKLDLNQQRGELVLLIKPYVKSKESEGELSLRQIEVLRLLSQELPAKKAVNLTYKLTGGSKELLYQYLLKSKDHVL
jgi:16S rRNA (cytidine1402-2'-O)-methyltransferase